MIAIYDGFNSIGNSQVTKNGEMSSPNQTLPNHLTLLCSPGIFIRGLIEAHDRNPETDLARYIEAYVTVQVKFPFELIGLFR